MFVKPSRAPVGKPSLVASSSGRAKKARYARLLPSTRKSSASRAGASFRSSSAPVRVFGDISASVSADGDRPLHRRAPRRRGGNTRGAARPPPRGGTPPAGRRRLPRAGRAGVVGGRSERLHLATLLPLRTSRRARLVHRRDRRSRGRRGRRARARPLRGGGRRVGRSRALEAHGIRPGERPRADRRVVPAQLRGVG